MNRVQPDNASLRRFRAELYDSVQLDRPRRQTRARTLAVLGLGAAGPTLVGKAIAAEIWASGAALIPWIAIGAMVGAGVVGTYRFTDQPTAATPSQVATALQPAPQARTEHSLEAEPPLAASSAIQVKVPSPPAVASLPRGTAESSSSASAAPVRVNLDTEVKLLDDARRALERGDSKASMEALDRYRQECSQAQLGHEAVVLRVQTLIKSGQCVQAKSVAEGFLAEHQDTAVERRIRSVLAGCGR